MSSSSSYTCCDMGLFDFFKRSSSRARSKTASHVTSAATTTTTTTISTTRTTTFTETSSLASDVSMVSVESASTSSESAGAAASTASASTVATRHSLPAAPAKESLDSTATTASSCSNNDDSDPFDHAAAPEAPASGSQGSIQNYEVVRELGRGATAVVQLGRHKDTAQLVALKVFKTSLLKKMREVKRVGRKMVVSTALDKVQVEIAIMKKLQHRNVLNLLEVFDDDTETLVLLLEYAPHGQIMQWDAAQRVYRANPAALKTKEATNGVFDEAALRPCVRQLLLGLAYLHNNDICHRDLKPENILLGADGVYKIADFGVAHLFEEEKQAREAAAGATAGGDNNQTAAPESAAPKKKGMVASTAGTYAFMAPETLKGQAYSAYDADVWALGITIYALAFGRIPYYHPDVVELFELIETQPLELGDNNSSVSDGLAALLRGMLEKDPAQRWSLQQCKQHAWLLEDLDEAARHEFLNVQHEQVTVSEEDVARAVTRVTSFNVLMRVQLGANKWKRKAMKSLDAKKRASLSGAPPTIDELEGGGDASRLSTASSLSDRASFHQEQAVVLQAKAAAAASSNAPSDNQQEL